jgi:hypothetical protein
MSGAGQDAAKRMDFIALCCGLSKCSPIARKQTAAKDHQDFQPFVLDKRNKTI